MTLKSLIGTLILALSTWCAHAHEATVDIQNAWARATVKGQMATGAFMTLTARHSTRLISASTPVGVAQIHAMKMDNNVMQMFELKEGLELPAGKPVELKPGSYHIMLMDLKAPLDKDTQVPVTLVFKDKSNAEQSITLNLPVRAGMQPGMAMEHGNHQHMPAKP